MKTSFGSLKRELVQDWEQAPTNIFQSLDRRFPGVGLLAQSDHGSQYATDHYYQLLVKHVIAYSMSSVGQCWDDSPM